MESGRGFSVATNGNRVADIGPLGRIHTVQVEVEPDDVEESEVNEEGGVPQNGGDSGGEETGEATGEGEETGSGKEAGVEEGTREETSQEQPPSPSAVPPPPTSRSAVPSTPEAQSPPSAPAQQLASPASEKGAPGPGRLSPSSLPTVAEGLQEAGRKAAATKKSKSKKSKGLSTKDLLPLHKDIGRSNKQLLEPATPEFKPTAEWVRYRDNSRCVCYHDNTINSFCYVYSSCYCSSNLV